MRLDGLAGEPLREYRTWRVLRAVALACAVLRAVIVAGFAALLLALLGAALAAVPAARAQAPESGAIVVPCGSRDALAQQLGQVHGEAQAGHGLLPTGRLMELFVSPTGSWTLLVTDASGRACVLAAGHDWQASAPGTAGHI